MATKLGRVLFFREEIQNANAQVVLSWGFFVNRKISAQPCPSPNIFGTNHSNKNWQSSMMNNLIVVSMNLQTPVT